MIRFMPKRYPDELLYSQLARYFAWSGHTRYRNAATDIFSNPYIHSDLEFVVGLNQNCIDELTKELSFRELIQDSTMFNYYARFLLPEQRAIAMNVLENGGTGIHKALRIGLEKEEIRESLRVCPTCIQEDRKKYGEAYYHRGHQMRGIRVCHIHGDLLVKTSVKLASKHSPSLYAAEQVVDKIEYNTDKGNPLQLELARYSYEILNASLDLSEKIPVGRFLRSEIRKTKYSSPRGEVITGMSNMVDDLNAYYSEISNLSFDRQRMNQIFKGKRVNPFEICLVAKFLDIPIEVLLRSDLSHELTPRLFDERVRSMRAQNMTYKEIAKELDAPINIVKPVGTGKYNSYGKVQNPLKPTRKKPIDWDAKDKEMYPLVKTEIERRMVESDEKPQIILFGAIGSAVGMRIEFLKKMPQCCKLIREYEESREQFWQRKIVWAVKKIREEGKNLTMTRMMEYTSIRKEVLLNSLDSMGIKLDR